MFVQVQDCITSDNYTKMKNLCVKLENCLNTHVFINTKYFPYSMFMCFKKTKLSSDKVVCELHNMNVLTQENNFIIKVVWNFYVCNYVPT